MLQPCYSLSSIHFILTITVFLKPFIIKCHQMSSFVIKCQNAINKNPTCSDQFETWWW